MDEIGVALLGLGNVGAGVVKLLDENAAAIEARLGARLAIRGVAVRDAGKERAISVERSLITTDADSLIQRDDVSIVCEVVGGEEEAFDFTMRAIASGKHVVTANKALLAVRGDEIFGNAERESVDVYYEAAVCGGVPIIRALREGLSSDRIEEIHGIVNGTSNYILATMASEGRDFSEILKEAQRLGYAEADPTLDISGGDSRHKLAILLMLCFGTNVDVNAIHVEGIESIAPVDMAYAERFGFVIKSLAIGRDRGSHIEARVHPAMVPESWMLADVPGAKNALYVRSYALGGSMFYGAGAGMMPTAMAVVSDLIEVGRNIRAKAAGALPLRSYARMTDRPLLPIRDVSSRYYLRFSVDDEPGVLGKVTTSLGEHGVSLSQVIQEERRSAEEPASVVVLTHTAREGDVQNALTEIADMKFLREPARVIRVAG